MGLLTNKKDVIVAHMDERLANLPALRITHKHTAAAATIGVVHSGIQCIVEQLPQECHISRNGFACHVPLQ
jgi:hypothetical protein